MLRKQKCLYSNNTSDFNINWQISDLTETNYYLELIEETPARTGVQRDFHTILLKDM